MRVGILIIGSLYWDHDQPRPAWRRERLCVAERERVVAPIRYGRKSKRRANTYTMVFSPSLGDDEQGTALAIPCKAQDLVEEAKWLWAAEAKLDREPEDCISARWGCVGLLENPKRPLPSEVRDEWTARVAQEKGYGELIRVAGEDPVVDKAGNLNITWPTTLAGVPLEWNALLATANSPLGSSRGYPSPEQIADAWITEQGRKELSYFQGNRKHDIKTHHDAKIQARLTQAGLLK